MNLMINANDTLVHAVLICYAIIYYIPFNRMPLIITLVVQLFVPYS